MKQHKKKPAQTLNAGDQPMSDTKPNPGTAHYCKFFRMRTWSSTERSVHIFVLTDDRMSPKKAKKISQELVELHNFETAKADSVAQYFRFMAPSADGLVTVGEKWTDYSASGCFGGVLTSESIIIKV